MRRSLIASVIFHILLVGLVLTGLPRMGDRLPVEQAITVEVVTAETVERPQPTPAAPAATRVRSRQAAAPAPPPPPAPAPQVRERSPEPPPPPAPATRAEPAPPEPPQVAPEPEPAPEPPPPPKRAEPKPTPPPKPADRPPPPPRQVAKPAPPEPPAPARTARAEPAPPPQTPERKVTEPKLGARPTTLDAMLRSVEEQYAAKQAEAEQDGRGREPAPGPQNLASPGTAQSQLTAGEISAIKRQIEGCWNVPTSVQGFETMQVQLRIIMNRDGSVSSVAVQDESRLDSDPGYRTVAESARRAVLSCQLSLPPEKFNLWRDMVMTFYPEDAING